MHVDVTIASTDTDGRVFLTWTPVQCTARLIDGPGAGQTVAVVVRNSGTVGKINFDDYALIDFPSGMLVFGGVNIAEPGSLEIVPPKEK